MYPHPMHQYPSALQEDVHVATHTTLVAHLLPFSFEHQCKGSVANEISSAVLVTEYCLELATAPVIGHHQGGEEHWKNWVGRNRQTA